MPHNSDPRRTRVAVVGRFAAEASCVSAFIFEEVAVVSEELKEQRRIKEKRLV